MKSPINLSAHTAREAPKLYLFRVWFTTCVCVVLVEHWVFLPSATERNQWLGYGKSQSSSSKWLWQGSLHHLQEYLSSRQRQNILLSWNITHLCALSLCSVFVLSSPTYWRWSSFFCGRMYFCLKGWFGMKKILPRETNYTIFPVYLIYPMKHSLCSVLCSLFFTLSTLQLDVSQRGECASHISSC